MSTYPPSFPVFSLPFTVPASPSDFREWLLSRHFSFSGPHTLLIKPPFDTDPDDERRYVDVDRSFRPRSFFGRVEENHLGLPGKLVHIQERYHRPLSPGYDAERGYQERDMRDVLECVLSRLDDQRTQATVSCYHHTVFGVFLQLLTRITEAYPGADPLAPLLARDFPNRVLPTGGCYVVLEHFSIAGNPDDGLWPGDVLTVEEAGQLEQPSRRFGGNLWRLVERGSLLNIDVEVPLPPLLPRVRELQQTPPLRIALRVPENIAVLAKELSRVSQERDSPLTLPRTFPFEPGRLSLAAPDVFPSDRYRRPPYKGFGAVQVSFTAPYPDPWGSNRLVIAGSMYPLVSGSTGRVNRTLDLGPVIVLDLSRRGEHHTRILAECHYTLANDYFGQLIREIQEQWPGTSFLESGGKELRAPERLATPEIIQTVGKRGRPSGSNSVFLDVADFLDEIGRAVRAIRDNKQRPTTDRVANWLNNRSQRCLNTDARQLRRWWKSYGIRDWQEVLNKTS